MESERKTYQLKNLQFKDEGEEATGSFTAVFATLNVVDKDGDLTLPGAFGEQKVIISAYGHESWYGALPVGKGRIYEQGDDAIVEGRFFLDTRSGMETYLTVKQVDELQEFSYALPEVDYEIRVENDKRIRVLKRITVNEVSPCLMGSGINTRLLNIKSGGQEGNEDGKRLVDHIEGVLDDVKKLIERLQAVKDMREEKGKEISPDTVKRMGDLECALRETVEKLEQLKRHDSDELSREFVRYQKTIAERSTHNEY